MADKVKLSLAPLQGYTDWVFREAYQKYFRGIDEFYTPFLVLQNNGNLKSAHSREVEPFSERAENLIPQFLAGSASEYQFFENYFSDLGYQQMNWNLGCPYPMVTKRGRGSGLLPFPERIKEILNSANSDKIRISIKLRLGLNENTEIFPVLGLLKEYNINELILHPRIGRQLYKGISDREMFDDALKFYNNSIAYNGDIESLEDYRVLLNQFPEINHVMIGRGVLGNLFLPSQIKGIVYTQQERTEMLGQFRQEIENLYIDILSGEAQLLQKLKPFWEYFSNHFNNDKKVFKMIKKASSIKKFEQAVDFAFQQGIKEI